MATNPPPSADATPLLEAILNLSRFHRDHERY